MDPDLSAIEELTDSLFDENHKTAYWKEFDQKLKSKIIETIFFAAEVKNKQKLAKISQRFDMETYLEVLDQELRAPGMFNTLSVVYTNLVEEEIKNLKFRLKMKSL